MAKLHEKLGLSKEQFEQMLKNPKGMDPYMREQVMKGTKGAGLKVIMGIVLPIIIFMLGLFFGINYLTSVIIEQTAEIPGDPTRFDPVASISAVKSHAGEGAKLISIDARYVSSDGTMDLTRTEPYSPRVEYELFLNADSEGKEPPPLGAGGVEGGFWYKRVSVDIYEPGQWRHVGSTGGGGSSNYSYQNKGMDRDEGSVMYGKQIETPNPKCSFGDLWAVAMDQGAPADAVADIKYETTYSGNIKYSFGISGTDFNYVFGEDCKIRENPIF